MNSERKMTLALIAMLLIVTTVIFYANVTISDVLQLI
ncbi:hypothetical protein BWD162_006020 [Bartonella sp. WD16.2]|nr:hypothetical protein BWD162_006020 [Bartonella sp. WD16.2]